ncbi:MAG TPA: hypothetical protein VL098_12860 [Flavipsychrobacter sp.]|nr:hypothetical protein [Flavipsychrobacter sp.]
MYEKLRHISWVFPLLLLLTGTIAVYPYYQYYVDPDAVAYVVVAKRYAEGEYLKAINGYWSPWSCWLTALLIKQQIEPFKAGIMINTLGAGAFLLASHGLFLKFLRDRLTLTLLNSTLAIFLIFAIYKQSFADLWGFFFLLVALQLLLKEQFSEKPFLWITLGCIGSLAYLAKAYAFPYFLFSTPIITALLLKARNGKFEMARWWRMNVVTIISFLLFSSPWIFLLHQKYGMWMTATSGSLNLSWYLIAHPVFKEGIDLLLPPVYADGIYYWEDPFVVNGAVPHFWNSPQLFLLQCVRIGYNMLKLSNSMNELSAFFLPVTLFAMTLVFVERVRQMFSVRVFIVSVSFLLFPLGYTLINFESRYLWYLLPVSLLLGALVLQRLHGWLSSRWLNTALLVVFCASYLSFPVWDMKAMYKKGEAEHQLAQQLKQIPVKGSFASNVSFGEEMQTVVRVAHFSQNAFYYMPLPPQSANRLLAELRRYRVKYYFQFASPADIPHLSFTDEAGVPFPEVFQDTSLVGLKVYELYQ